MCFVYFYPWFSSVCLCAANIFRYSDRLVTSCSNWLTAIGGRTQYRSVPSVRFWKAVASDRHHAARDAGRRGIPLVRWWRARSSIRLATISTSTSAESSTASVLDRRDEQSERPADVFVERWLMLLLVSMRLDLVFVSSMPSIFLCVCLTTKCLPSTVLYCTKHWHYCRLPVGYPLELAPASHKAYTYLSDAVLPQFFFSQTSNHPVIV